MKPEGNRIDREALKMIHSVHQRFPSLQSSHKPELLRRQELLGPAMAPLLSADRGPVSPPRSEDLGPARLAAPPQPVARAGPARVSAPPRPRCSSCSSRCYSRAQPRPCPHRQPWTACGGRWIGSTGEAPRLSSSCRTSTRQWRCRPPATSRLGVSSPSLTSTVLKVERGSFAFTFCAAQWFRIAEQLKVKLERCNDTFCLPTTPQVVYGVKGASADMFLDNAEYRKFLFREFGVSTIDEESAAVVMVFSKLSEQRFPGEDCRKSKKRFSRR